MKPWQETIAALKSYGAKKESLQLLPEKIAALDWQMQALPGGRPDREPVCGGPSGQGEERLLQLICEKEKLICQYQALRCEVRLLEQAMALLEEKHRRVLDGFYLHRQPGHVARLTAELGYGEAQIYRLKNAALKQLSLWLGLDGGTCRQKEISLK